MAIVERIMRALVMLYATKIRDRRLNYQAQRCVLLWSYASRCLITCLYFNPATFMADKSNFPSLSDSGEQSCSLSPMPH